MTSRQQILRSSTPGQQPAAGTRAPGEVWTTFPDLQLGVIDASKNAQKLIAVRFFSTAANYAVGDFVVQAGALYVANSAVTAGAFNASKWNKLVVPGDPASGFLLLSGGTLTGKLTLSGPPTNPLDAVTKAYADSGSFLPVGGGTMTGDLILNRDPVVPLGAMTKQYVDALPKAMNDNRIINGDMRIDQRNGGTAGTAAGYTVDRWQYQSTVANKAMWQRQATTLPDFPYQLGCASSSAYSVVAGDFFVIQQVIEADQISDFAWGAASAKPVTLSFWAISSLTGTFGGSLQNYTYNRSYPFSYSIPSANTWTKIVLTIPGDTGGTWVMSGNGGSLTISFSLGMGSTRSGLANAWAAANYLSVPGAVSVVGTNSATFYLTGVKLEIGSVATPFNRQSLAKSMADCQRYFSTLQLWMQVYSGASQGFGQTVTLPTTMRAAPTLTFSAMSYTNASGVAMAVSSNISPSVYAVAIAAGTATFTGAMIASAEL